MEKEKLKELLHSVEIPEPDATAQEKARQAAMAEFHRQEMARKEKIKGIPRRRRLTGKTLKGGPVMRKPLYITAGLATGLIALMIAFLMPNFLAYRTRGPGEIRHETAPMTDIARMPSSRPVYDKRPQSMVLLEENAAERGAGDAGRTMQGAVPAAESTKKLYQPSGKAMPAVPSTGPRSEQFRTLGKYSPMKKERVSFQDQTYVGRDRFETITVNPIKLVSEAPVSTFSVDVDTASYAFVRRALNNGVLPQKDAVRVEELINYFDYDYSLPDEKTVPFRSTAVVFPAPWNPDTRLLHIGIKGLDIIPEKRPRANLVFLIDVSGSMQGRDKLPLLKNAFRMLVDRLDPEDVVSMVVYAGAAGTVLEPTKVKEKGKIIAALDRLRAGGSTAGGEGIRRAYALAGANFDSEGVNRVILATDGDFNVGIRNPEELKGFVERKRKTGISLSVLGFGQGNYNDALMQKLAQNGNGNAAYIDTLNEARKVLVDEAHSTLFTIAKDVKIQVEFNPARVAEYRLIGYETRMLRREDFNNDRVDAGDIGSGHSVTAIYEMTPKDGKGRMIDDLRYSKPETTDVQNEKTSGEYAFLKIRYKLPGEKTSRLITTPITVKNEHSTLDTVNGEIRFAASVAAFGHLLRGDPYVKDFTYDDVIGLAEPVRGKDSFGYRAEFLNLVRLAKTARVMGDR